MASTEAGALLTSDTTEPVISSTKRWTQVGFGAAAIAVLISVFSGEDGILASLIFVALCIGLAYLGYRYLIMGKVPADLGLAYFACGMWPLLVSYSVIAIVWGLFIMFTSGGIVRGWNPLWYRNIGAATSEAANHGQLLVNGVPLHDADFSRALHHHPIIKHKHIALPVAVSRTICVAVPKVMRAALPLHGHTEAETMPSLEFEDGTKAAPLIGNVLRAIAGVPYAWLLFIGFIYVIGVSYALQALVYAFTLRPLKRAGATVVSVVACSRAIVLGFVALAFIVKNMSNIVVFTLFIIYALFELGLCTFIALRAYANEHAVLEPERKSVLLEPVILQVLYSYLPLIGVVIFFKNAVPIAAKIVESTVTVSEGAMQIAKWFIAIPVAFLPQIILAIYAVRVARKRYTEATSVI